MDLINRKALFNDLCKDREEGTFEFTDSQAEAADKIIVYVTKRINAQPTVPAVPLDKLCEWMSDNVYLKDDTGGAWELNSDNWKKLLTKWMEEQNAVD
jgi:hypothetical protein